MRDAVRYSILAELDLKIPENEASVDEATGKLKTGEDPFLIAGYGMNAFFSVQDKLIKMMLFITAVMTPIMMIYAMNEEQGVRQLPSNNPLTWVTIGNLGGS